MAGVALAAGGYSIVVNGQAVPRPAVVINGEPYVPLSALKGLGITGSLKGKVLTLSQKRNGSPASPAAGGANQITALEGMNRCSTASGASG